MNECIYENTKEKRILERESNKDKGGGTYYLIGRF